MFRLHVDVEIPAFELRFKPETMEIVGALVRAALERQARAGRVGRKADGSPATLRRSGDFWSEVDIRALGDTEAELTFRMPYAEILLERFPLARELDAQHLAEVEQEAAPHLDAGAILVERG